MPFHVRWRDEAKRDFRSLAARDMQRARQLIGSFPHDRWHIGSAYRVEGIGAGNVRALRNGSVTLVYLIDEAAEVVEVLAVRVGE